MKRVWILSGLIATVAHTSLTTQAGGPVPVQLANESVRMNPGDCSCGFGLVWTISFSSTYTEDPVWANGEFAPLPQPGNYSHWSYLVLEDPSMFASTTYAEMNLPSEDGDGNGIPDFFEVGRPVSTGTTGTYAVIWGPGYGQLQFQWLRAANSPVGTCVLTMIDPILGQMGPFSHTFELVEAYSGSLTYTAGSNVVSGSISIARAAQTPLTGSLTIQKVATNRFNLLTLTGGNWSNQTDTFAFGDTLLIREPGQPTVYQSRLQNPGGNYRSWRISITDTNDANANGIPDFSDDPLSPPRRPTLSLLTAPTQLQLRVSGDIGHKHLIQQATNLTAPNWTTIQSVTLTNDPQFVTMPLPMNSPAFWRVKAE